MHNFLRLFLILVVISTSGSLDSFVCADDIPNYRKKTFAFEAIADLHSQLDEDSNGGVDFAEASLFLRDKLSSPVEQHHQRDLSQDDGIISLLDLWVAWQKNPAHNWTVGETARWISDFVELPEYVSVFTERQFDGESLPRLVARNTTFFNDELGIRNPLHRRKLALKTMDLILFGPPKKNLSSSASHSSAATSHFGVTRDLPVLLLSGLVIATAFVVAFFGLNYHFSRRLRSVTSGNYDRLSRAEQTLQHLQQELLRLKDVEPTEAICHNGRRPSNVVNDEAYCQHSDSGQSSDQMSLISTKGRQHHCVNSLASRKTAGHQKHRGSGRRRRTVGLDSQPPPTTTASPPFWSTPPPTSVSTTSTINSSPVTSVEGGFYLPGSSERPSTSSRRATTASTVAANPKIVDCPTPRPSIINELALWLQLTHELELRSYWEKRSAAAKQLMSAKEACDRVRRKRLTFVGSVRLIHSDNLDDVDSKLNVARCVLENVTADMHERTLRWNRIEELTGLSLQQPTDVNALMAALGCSTENYRGAGGRGAASVDGGLLPESCSSPRLYDLSTEFSLFGNGFGSWVEDSTEEQHASPRNDDFQSRSGVRRRPLLGANESHHSLCDAGCEGNSSTQENCGVFSQPRPALPRSNYSFVRPFATLWRRKAKTHIQQPSPLPNYEWPSPTATTSTLTRLSISSTSTSHGFDYGNLKD